MAIKMARFDWIALKTHRLRALVVPLVIFLFSYTMPLYAVPLAMMFSQIFAVNVFFVEEKNDLSRLYLSFPVSRRDIVAGRYILSLAMLLVGTLVGTAIMLFCNKYGSSHFYFPADWNIFIFTIGFFLSAMFNLIIYPILFKLGYKKGQFWGLYLPTFIVGLLLFLYRLTSSKNMLLTMDILGFASENKLLTSGILFAFAILFFGLSLLISTKVYKKREF